MEKDCNKLLEEALNEVKLYYNNAKECGDYKTVARIESKFPQLKDSEDERIRKSLIKDFKNYYEMYDKSCGEPKWGSDCLLVKDILDWLERRKELKPVSVVRIPKFRVGDIIQRVPFEKCDRGARISSIDENGYNIDFTHIGDNVSGGYIGFSFENEYELVGQKPLSTEETELNSVAFLEQMGYTCIPPEKDHQTKWSEEEFEIFRKTLAKDAFLDEITSKRVAKKLLNSVKSLDPHWKPSKEQMEALYNIEFKNFKKFGPILESLYNDLKKL